MKATIAMCCVLLGAAPACGQFIGFGEDERFVMVYTDSGDEEAHATPMTPFDAIVTGGVPATSFASASQMSRVSRNEIFISGGTGDVFWQSTNERSAGAISWADLTFQVGSPTQVRVRYELAIDTTSFHSWTGGAGLNISLGTPIVSIGASTRSNEGMVFSPSAAFEIDSDGYARTMFDEVVTLMPNLSYELRSNAVSRCPGAMVTDTCIGKPISYTTHLQVIPEPSTWLLATATACFLLWRRQRH